LEVDEPGYWRGPSAAAEVLSTVREQARLARSSRGIEVLHHDDAVKVLRDRRVVGASAEFFEENGATPKILRFLNDQLFLMPPEKHLRIRRVMTRGFTLANIQRQEAEMARTAQRLSAGLDPERCDLVEDFARPYAAELLCRFAGLPLEDIDTFLPWFDEIGRVSTGGSLVDIAAPVDAALDSLHGYVSELVAARTAKPQEDFISGLIEAQRTEGRLTPEETTGCVANIMFAGVETTRYQIPATARAMIENRVWQRVADDPDLVSAAVEEGIRFAPIINYLVRIASESFDLADRAIPAGTVIAVNVWANGRDPDRFRDPDTFDLTRNGTPALETFFGTGVHKCLGHMFARTSMNIAIASLVEAIRAPQITGDVLLTPGGAAPLAIGPTRLPISFSSAA
jgi:cytochrome P450